MRFLLKKDNKIVGMISNYMSTVRVLSKGKGFYGALGQSENLKDSVIFKDVLNLPVDDSNSQLKSIVQVSAGWGHSAVVTNNGRLFVFGRPYDFSNLMQLNRIDKISSMLSKFVSRSTNSAVFGSVKGFYEYPREFDNVGFVKSVSCSAGLTVVLNKKGEVFSFGQNRWKQCGFEAENMHILEPRKIDTLQTCKQVDAGLQHCVALTEGGEVYSWGKTVKGQLGLPDLDDMHNLPARVKLLSKENKKLKSGRVASLEAVSICAGFCHSAAVTVDGAVYVWGKGMSTTVKSTSGSSVVLEDQETPRRVELPDGRKAIQVVSSNFNIVILAEDRSLWCLGLGESDRSANPIPLRVQSDFHTAEGARIPIVTFPLEHDAPPASFFIVPADARLFKGYVRVALVVPGERRSESAKTGPSGSLYPSDASYEVVLQGGEAFLIELSIDCCAPPGAASSITGGENIRIVDHSSGWQHSLVVVETR